MERYEEFVALVLRLIDAPEARALHPQDKTLLSEGFESVLLGGHPEQNVAQFISRIFSERPEYVRADRMRHDDSDTARMMEQFERNVDVEWGNERGGQIGMRIREGIGAAAYADLLELARSPSMLARAWHALHAAEPGRHTLPPHWQRLRELSTYAGRDFRSQMDLVAEDRPRRRESE